MKEKLASLAKSRYFIPGLMMIVSISLVVYAATSVQVHNSVTITSGANILVAYQTALFTGGTCPPAGTGYSAAPPSVTFIEHAGGSNNTFLCIDNTGTGTDNPSVTITGGNPTSPDCAGGGPCFSLTTTPSTLAPIPASAVSGQIMLTITNSYTIAGASTDLIITVT